jgi:vancomycin resistance protein YoaR
MSVPRSAKVGGLVVAVLVGLVAVSIGSLWLVQRGQTLPNTYVAGLDVGGLDADELRAVLDPVAEDRESAAIVFDFHGTEFELQPTEVGYTVDVDATVTAALERGRSGLPGDIAERLRSLRSDHEVVLIDRFDDAAVEAWVAELAAELDRDERTGSVTVDPDSLEIDVEMPSGFVRVDQAGVAGALRSALGTDGEHRFEVPAETAPQAISDEAVLAAADQVEQAVAGPFELHADDTSLTLRPHDLARIIEVVEVDEGDGLALELVVSAEQVDAVFGDVARSRFETEPVSASYTTDRTPPVSFDVQGSGTFNPVDASVEIIEGRDGTRFDPALAAEQLTLLLRDGARAGQLRLQTAEPELSNERAQDLRPTHLLGTFTTYYTAGEPRSHNIQLLADTIDEALVLPGEQFSINEISGQRTCDKGYLEAGTIIQGELVPTCGGGTSQFGTTTFNAAFFSGVQLDQWKAHSWYISRYPMGREATLSYPELDVRFTNTTDAAILVKTDHTATSITVSVYGQPIATAVSATHGEPTNPTDYSTQRRPDNSLGRGQERVVQAGTGGFTVEVVRTIELTNGSSREETIRTVYVPQTRIVEYGPPA